MQKHIFITEYIIREKTAVLREWAPNASEFYLIGDFSGWKISDDFSFRKINDQGDWELEVDSTVFKARNTL